MKKALVLDLDNTLWGGVVGEDGINGIKLSLQAPGNSFLAFQQAILDHYDRGVILAINSRNNPEDALAVIRTHPNMILKEKHFAAMRINWNDKAENLRELAEELNIGLDSFVFLDDDPVNRGNVRATLPEVEVPELPQDPSQYASFLHSLPYFETKVITDEDKLRGNLYVTERLRKEEEKNFENKEEFLKSLSLKLYVKKNDESALSRHSQLTEKTNQFNANKHPLSEEELRLLMNDGIHAVYHAKLLDKFGDHGIIAFALVERDTASWRVKQLLMSCRVFGRGVEDAFMSFIAKEAQNDGVKSITIEFTPTEKNQPAKDFLDKNFNTERAASLESFMAPDWIEIIYG